MLPLDRLFYLQYLFQFSFVTVHQKMMFITVNINLEQHSVRVMLGLMKYHIFFKVCSKLEFPVFIKCNSRTKKPGDYNKLSISVERYGTCGPRTTDV